MRSNKLCIKKVKSLQSQCVEVELVVQKHRKYVVVKFAECWVVKSQHERRKTSKMVWRHQKSESQRNSIKNYHATLRVKEKLDVVISLSRLIGFRKNRAEKFFNFDFKYHNKISGKLMNRFTYIFSTYNFFKYLKYFKYLRIHIRMHTRTYIQT